MSQHHKFGPSALKYIEICPGFRNSNETNPVAEEGTFLHEACETGNLDGLSSEQKGLVSSCLTYVGKLEEGADEVHKEVRLIIRTQPNERREETSETGPPDAPSEQAGGAGA